MTDRSNAAGGRATEAGMSFQAYVATWFAAQMLADAPVGSAFGLPATLRVVGLQCETGDAIDDIVVRFDDGASIFLQCKTQAGLTTPKDSPLARALDQLVQLYLSEKPVGSVRALLAVPEDAHRSLDKLESACRLFDHGGTWIEVIDRATLEAREALELFQTHVRSKWLAVQNTPPQPDDLVKLARLFHIHRFPADATSDAWRNAAHLLGRSLYGSDGKGETPMLALLALSRRLILTGAPIDRVGALAGLRTAGHIDVAAPGFDSDIQAMLAYSEGERSRLRKHMSLPIDGGLPLKRDCFASLQTAAEGGSLLVTGEPGAGKTGILLMLAEAAAKGPVLFLSVERFAAFRMQSDFRAELNLNHNPIEVLQAWPGKAPGLLILDALDASRGGTSEAVIATFIEEAVERLGSRWSVIASIRSFDLRNGRRFRKLMPGAAPNPDFAENGLGDTRHFCIPRLSGKEVSVVAAESPKLRELESSAPRKLQDLLRNIFNLSLASDLLDSGDSPQSIRTVATQSELIKRYEDIRLPGQRLRLGAKAVVQVMVQHRQLTVRATDIENEAVEEMRNAGVLISGGDNVSFAHHVLFDHIAARFYLSWNEPETLKEQLTKDPTIGLMLGPAFRFALEELWQRDGVGRPTTWRLLAELAATARPDPVVLGMAMRSVAEHVDAITDVDALLDLIESRKTSDSLGTFVGQLARFVGMSADESGGFSSSAAEAWARVASTAAATKVGRLADAARVLLATLAERANLGDSSFLIAFGRASRTLLNAAWSLSPGHQNLTTAAIRLVAKSYQTDPGASRALLERILNDRFEAYAPQEAPWLAEGVPAIFPYDPLFVTRIYETLFRREVTDEGKTWLGGAPSRILPVTSTRRQDYELARWHLSNALSPFLEAQPIAGTAAVIGAVRGLDIDERHGRNNARESIQLDIGRHRFQIIDDHLSLKDWREERGSLEEPLSAFAVFLRDCPRKAFREAVATVLAAPANASIWARILGVAADRAGVADDLLWPLATDPHFAAIQGLSRDAIIFLAASYPRQSEQSRAEFESTALKKGLFPTERESNWWASILKRLLSLVPEDLIATSGLRARRAELESSKELTGNPPLISMEIGWRSQEVLVEGLLMSDGANLDRSPEREIRAASRRLEDRLKQQNNDLAGDSLVSVWRDIDAVIRQLDGAAGQAPHPEVVHSSWGAISNGVESIAKSKAYSPELPGLPDLNSLLALIDRLTTSPYPSHDGATGDGSSWGNWDVRVFAASSLMALATRFGGTRPDIVDRIEASLRDPAAAVRLQAVRELHALRYVAPHRMWALATQVAQSEPQRSLLGFFAGGTLSALAHAEPFSCAQILDLILERDWAGSIDRGGANRAGVEEAFANLAAHLCVVYEQSIGWKWIKLWTSDLTRGGSYLVAMLHDLRPAFFFSYLPEPKREQVEIAKRARQLLDQIVAAGVGALAKARPNLQGLPPADSGEIWRPLYEAGDAVIDQVCNQLYFGSGAVRSPQDRQVGLRTSLDKSRFLSDYNQIVDSIATHAQTRTQHHLFELLTYLVEGDPPDVFDRIAKILLGPAAADGYHFESLGLTSIVRLIRLYLADYRSIFDHATRRSALIAVLELFSSVGWPEALKLLYELPDLLR